MIDVVHSPFRIRHACRCRNSRIRTTVHAHHHVVVEIILRRFVDVMNGTTKYSTIEDLRQAFGILLSIVIIISIIAVVIIIKTVHTPCCCSILTTTMLIVVVLPVGKKLVVHTIKQFVVGVVVRSRWQHRGKRHRSTTRRYRSSRITKRSLIILVKIIKDGSKSRRMIIIVLLVVILETTEHTIMIGIILILWDPRRGWESSFGFGFWSSGFISAHDPTDSSRSSRSIILLVTVIVIGVFLFFFNNIIQR